MSDIKLDKFDQIGIVVHNIEKAAQMYRKLFNFKGNINIVEQNATVNYKGKEATFSMKKIMQFFGGKQFEIVEVVDATGPNLYSEFIAEGNTVKQQFNVKIAQVGKLGKLTFTYLDTKDILGYYIEILEF
ncbi:MAG: hypothetical protein ACTSQL_06740 [Promethearchaeota archaeon]